MRAGAPFPKFVIHCGILLRELRKQRGTSKYMILVPLFDLKFLNELAASAVGTSNRRHWRNLGSVARIAEAAVLTVPSALLGNVELFRCAKLNPAADRAASLLVRLVAVHDQSALQESALGEAGGRRY